MTRPAGSAQQGPTYPLSVAAEMEAAKVGDVVRPYIGQNGATISKVLGFGDEKTATVRHILVNAGTAGEFDAAQAKAHSILRVIKAENNFEEMVVEFSQDPASKNNGGKY